MKTYDDILKSHSEANPPNYGDSDIQSILEMLWNTYCQHNQLDSTKIKDAFTELYRHLKDVPVPDMNGVIDTVCSLCWEHEKVGFVEGIKVGLCLLEELS